MDRRRFEQAVGERTPISRRSFLRGAASTGSTLGLAGLSGLAGCVQPRPERRLLQSAIAAPQAFRAPLPLLPRIQSTPGADGIARIELEARAGLASIVPGFTTRVSGYNGIFPGPVLETRSGQRTMVLLSNRLQEPVVQHLHGGRTAPGSDGFPTDLIEPLAGSGPQLSEVVPGARGRGWQALDYSNQQRAAMLWYHDHRMDYTGRQVWQGLLGVYLIRDDEEDALRLPAGDAELVLILTDRAFDSGGQMPYPVDSRGMLQQSFMGGLMGDVLLVNGAPWPTHSVSTGLYRLRIVNASNSRDYRLGFDRRMPAGFQFLQIGTDGGLMRSSVARSEISLAPAERVDVLVDFRGCEPRRPVHLLNLDGEGAMGQVMQFVPQPSAATPPAALPNVLSQSAPPARQANLVERTFDFKYSRRRGLWTVNGLPYDPNRIDAKPRLGTTEIWHLRTDYTHPLHLHLVHFGVLEHAGKPAAGDSGWKDTINMVAGESSTIIVPFTGFTGRYVFHCHNLEHEDMRMMANFEVVA